MFSKNEFKELNLILGFFESFLDFVWFSKIMRCDGLLISIEDFGIEGEEKLNDSENHLFVQDFGSNSISLC